MCSLFTIILCYYSGKPAQLEEIDHPDWVPHVNMGYTTSVRPEVSQQRYDRLKARKMRLEVDDIPLVDVETGMLM